MRLRISTKIEETTAEIYKYISPDSIKYAKETVYNINSRMLQVEDFPHIGRYVPELKLKQYRELIYKSYHIVYEVNDISKIIYFHFIVHSRQNFKSFYRKFKIKFFNS